MISSLFIYMSSTQDLHKPSPLGQHIEREFYSGCKDEREIFGQKL